MDEYEVVGRTILNERLKLVRLYVHLIAIIFLIEIAMKKKTTLYVVSPKLNYTTSMMHGD